MREEDSVRNGAYFIEKKSGQVLIELPGEAVVGGLRAWVPEDDLTYAMTA
jgi:hypothetical protein